jgi:hypothetical protein
MDTPEKHVAVTVELPQRLYEQVMDMAASEQQPVEKLLPLLVAEGLDTHRSVGDLWNELAGHVQARLTREGQAEESSDEVLASLRKLREELARAYYP